MHRENSNHMNKSSATYLFECYIWLVNTIARGPISRTNIDDKWARASINDYKKDSIPESTFHRWRAAAESLFDITIKCNSLGEYYIENKDNICKTDIRGQILNLMHVNNLLKDSKNLRNQIIFEPISSNEIYLSTIIEALRDKYVIKITYQGFGKNHASTFNIEPYCLKMFKQRWYLLAYSQGVNSLRIYSLDRIHAIKSTSQKYKLPDNFDAEEYFKNTYGISGIGLDPQIIEIKINEYQANYLRTLPIHSSQEEIERNDKYSIFRYNITPTIEFIQELRKYGAALEVLTPKTLRENFKNEAKKMSSIYK